MADSIQLLSLNKNDVKQGMSKSENNAAKDQEETFLMLMELMFPKPEEKKVLQFDEINQKATEEGEEVVTTSPSDTNLPDGLNQAEAAVILGAVAYGQGQSSDEASQETGQVSLEQDSEVVINEDSSVIAASNEVLNQVSKQSQENEASRFAQQIQPSNSLDEQTAKLKLESQQVVPGLEEDALEESDLRQLQLSQNNHDKQSKSEQLLSDLFANKLAYANTSDSANNQSAKTVDSVVNDLAGLNFRSSPQGEQITSTQAPVKTITIPTPVTHSDWSNQFNQQIVWLSQQPIKSAVIRLNPKEMGALEVNLKMDKDHATIQMTTVHENARDLIEQSIPKLREMLQQQGLQLNDVNVQTRQQHDAQQQTQQENRFNAPNGSHEQSSLSIDEGNESQLNYISKGLVDYFA